MDYTNLPSVAQQLFDQLVRLSFRVSRSPRMPSIATILTLVGFCLGVTVTTEHPKIAQLPIFRVPVYVVHNKRDWLPNPLRTVAHHTLIAASFNQIRSHTALSNAGGLRPKSFDQIRRSSGLKILLAPIAAILSRA